MKVAAFNIQKFGTNKVSDPQILPILIKIVSRYDIIVILEVVDAKGKSVKTFLQELNKANKEHRYTMEISTRLGRTRYKEQYLFLYRDDVVDLIGTYQFADKQAGQEDAFAREPYVLRFKCHNTVMNDLVLMPVHTKPVEAEKELDELYDVFLDVKRKWGTDNIMILGDFNADGSYVSKKEMKLIRIRSDKNFHWLISDDVDTTANHKNDHTYDRIVVYGDDMLAAVVPNSAKPFNFQQEYGLTNAQPTGRQIRPRKLEGALLHRTGPLQQSGSPPDGRSRRGLFFRPWWQQLGHPGIWTGYVSSNLRDRVHSTIIYEYCRSEMYCCSYDRKYSGVAATTHCHPTVPYRGNSETNSHTPVCMPYAVAEY
ncbi:deoxyribonuclease-1-like isoform X8 [Osmerus mordax]|uniref:deoxyribonuclease-1-like isoform X8 n=1 Tax=Osmerus mordax TaxID=8014 RepID=UPI00351033D7